LILLTIVIDLTNGTGKSYFLFLVIIDQHG